MGWAIAYDHTTELMGTDGMTESEIVLFYNSVRDVLYDKGFVRSQLSVYVNPNTDARERADDVFAALKTMPKAVKYINRLHLFRVEDVSDVLPLVAGRPSAPARNTSLGVKKP
ncbi:hypothetical protein [Chondromyces crocatus]|uniref:Uncharacterized protein n=1 Tax=Chondromyces crocatus TaxID=52 RepID=A0A0K1EFE2_CHOCO|nr:hypothetical protein [Chondromyces crocatus]AKT39559.1 uncharacterized protein CMC5_037060 [Chondromyces crocatus]